MQTPAVLRLRAANAQHTERQTTCGYLPTSSVPTHQQETEAPATHPVREKEVRSLKLCLSPAAICTLAAVKEDWKQGSTCQCCLCLLQQSLSDAYVCPVCASDSCGCLPVFPGASGLEIWDGTTQNKKMVERAVLMLKTLDKGTRGQTQNLMTGRSFACGHQPGNLCIQNVIPSPQG